MEIARAAAPQSADRPVVRADAGPAGELPETDHFDLTPAPAPDRWVWIVILASGPSLGEEGSIVVIDFLDGGVYGVVDIIG